MKALHLSFLFACLVTPVVYGAAEETPVATREITKSEVSFNGVYSLGEKVTISNENMEIDGISYEVSPIVNFPGGYSVESNEVTLTDPGHYTVTYLKVIDGINHVVTKSFDVIIPLISKNDDNSIFQYGEKITEYNLLQSNTINESFVNDVEGLNVTLAKDDVLTFNNLFDLTNTNSLLEFYVTPNKIGELDVEHLYIQFTDANNEDSYFIIDFKLYRTDGYIYITAKAKDQSYIGNQPIYENGSFSSNKPQINNLYGYPALYTSPGIVNKNAVQLMKVVYDKETNATYFYNKGANTLICDFDDLALQSSPWEGFNSKYAKVKMWGDGFKNKTASFFFTNICKTNLDYEIVDDSNAPEISFDQAYDFMNMPDAKTNQKYEIMTAKANDLICGSNITVKTKVVKNYDRLSGIYNTPSFNYSYEIDCSNGYFIPRFTGKCSIIYSCEDYFGNYVEYVSTIDVKENIPNNLSIQIDKESDISYVGNFTKLANITNFGGYTNGFHINCEVISNGKKAEINGNYLDGFNFIPTEEGTYDVIYTLSDSVGNAKTTQYQINVSKTNNPTIVGEVTLPKYFISGYDYNLPKLLNSKGEECEITITDAAGTRNIYNRVASFVGEEASVTYKSYDCSLSYNVKVVNVFVNSNIIFGNYFDGNTFYETGKQGLIVSSKKDDVYGTFINQLLISKFCAEIKVDQEKNKFNEITIYLEDAKTPSQKIKVSLVKEADGVYYYLNDKTTGVKCSDVFNGEKFTVSFNTATNRFTDGTNSGVKVTETIYGTEFKGFNSGYVYVGFGMEQVKARSNYIISSLNNQTINESVFEDRIKPEIEVASVPDEQVSRLGSVFYLSNALYADVLSPIQSATLSVSVNDKNIAALDGTVLQNASCDKEYSILLNEYGKYIVTYYVVDANGKYQGYSYSISVIDQEKPVITTSMTSKTVSLGDIVIVEDATASDAIDGELSVEIFVMDPSFKTRYLTEKKYFTATQVGEYIVYYVARDASGNTETISFIVTVKEAR